MSGGPSGWMRQATGRRPSGPVSGGPGTSKSGRAPALPVSVSCPAARNEGRTQKTKPDDPRRRGPRPDKWAWVRPPSELFSGQRTPRCSHPGAARGGRQDGSRPTPDRPGRRASAQSPAFARAAGRGAAGIKNVLGRAAGDQRQCAQARAPPFAPLGVDVDRADHGEARGGEGRDARGCPAVEIELPEAQLVMVAPSVAILGPARRPAALGIAGTRRCAPPPGRSMATIQPATHGQPQQRHCIRRWSGHSGCAAGRRPEKARVIANLLDRYDRQDCHAACPLKPQAP